MIQSHKQNERLHLKSKILSIALCTMPFALFGDFEPNYRPNRIANICKSKQAQDISNRGGGGIALGIKIN